MDYLSSSAEVREALQLRLLVELMGNAISKELILKGGLALRMVHGSIRYTKDLDLDADSAFPMERIQGIARRAISRATASQLIEDATVSEPKQTETTLRWKIAGRIPGGGAPATPPVIVRSQNQATLAANKVLALTDPRRFAVRDLYDLHVLINAEVDSPVEQLAALAEGRDRLDLALAELWPKIASMTWQQFRSDVAPFLPTSFANAIDSEAFEEIRLAVGVRVEEWLNKAIRLVPPEEAS